jgi:hypothetical protein
MPASEPTTTHAGRESERGILAAMIGERSLGVQGGKKARSPGPIITMR